MTDAISNRLAVLLVLFLVGCVFAISASLTFLIYSERERLKIQTHDIFARAHEAYSTLPAPNSDLEIQKWREIDRMYGIQSKIVSSGTEETLGNDEYSQSFKIDNQRELRLTKSISVSFWRDYRGTFVIYFLIQILIFSGILLLFYAWSKRVIIEPINEIVRFAETGEGRFVRETPLSETETLYQVLNNLFVKLKLRSEREAFGQVSASVAHDIRSPLGALKVLVSRIEKKIQPDEKSLLVASITRIEDIANNLIQRYRQARGSDFFKFPSDFEEVIAEKKLLSPNIEIRFRGNFTGQLSLPKDALLRLISNLIGNSIEARADKILLAIRVSPRSTMLRIRDDGCGIPKEVLPALGAMQVSYGKNHGTGLGLFTAREALTRAGGQMKIYSRQGRWTAILLVIPRDIGSSRSF